MKKIKLALVEKMEGEGNCSKAYGKLIEYEGDTYLYDSEECMLIKTFECHDTETKRLISENCIDHKNDIYMVTSVGLGKEAAHYELAEYIKGWHHELKDEAYRLAEDLEEEINNL